MITPLSYELLDDIMMAVAAGRSQAARVALQASTVSTLGPLLEYAFQNSARSAASLIPGLPKSRVVNTLNGVLRNRQGPSSSLEPLEYEFQLIPRNPESFVDAPWISYCKRLERAARNAGFDGRSATGFTGAFVEMVDNVAQHSENIESAIVGYRWLPKEFEYVVTDGGIGVLRSLRKNVIYQNLNDHASALRTALSQGESRFGPGSGHGNGFRAVFLSLAQYRGSLRFRSGDQALEINGRSPELLNHRVSQRVLCKGFSISVLCRL